MALSPALEVPRAQERCAQDVSFSKCINPFGPWDEWAAQRVATVSIVFPGKLQRKTNKLTNHKSYFLALSATN